MIPSRAARRNISRVADLESEFEQRRSNVDRVVARLASWTGSMRFLLFHLLWFALWIGFNLFAKKPFDPYPFALLSSVVSCEAVLLTSVVLMEQTWMGHRDERRDHLHLQVNLLAEQEITKVLALQRLICKRLGIHEAELDPDVAEMSKETAVEHLAEELGNTLDSQ